MATTIERLIEELSEFLVPICRALSSPEEFEELLLEMGYDPTGANLATIINGLSGTRDKAMEIIDAVDNARSTGTPMTSAELVQIAQKFSVVLGKLPDVRVALGAIGAVESFAGDLLDHCLVGYLHERIPPSYSALEFLGVVEAVEVMPGSGPDARPAPYTRHHLRWDRVGRFWRDPSSLMEEVYGWGTASFRGEGMMRRLARFFGDFGLVANAKELPAPVLNRFADPNSIQVGVEIPLYRKLDPAGDAEIGLMLVPLKGDRAPVDADRGIALMPYGRGQVNVPIDVHGDGTLKVTLSGSAVAAGGVVFGLRPSGLKYDAGVTDNAVAGGSVRIEVEKKAVPGQRIIIFGDPASTRLTCEGMTLTVGGEDGDFFVAGGVKALQFVVDVSDDGLLGTIIPDPITIDAGDLVAGWRLGRGVYFEQGSALRIRIPLNVDILGVFRVHELGADIEFEPELSVVLLVSADATIGPLFLGVEELGLRLTVVPKENGAFGKFDVEAGLQLPSGYAAYLDGGPIKGGGALFIEEHEYRGALALQFQSFGLSAFAILTTQLPSGQKGFSFLATLFGEFEIQLGYGFKLTGLGGLIGIDRTSNVEALRSTLRLGQLDSVLFPRNPIQDASVILNNMAAIFPPTAGQHIFGPMAKIAWGTPTLIEVKLGVVLEVGRQVRVLILGSVLSELPVKEAALVVFRLDFIGCIDFSTGAIGFDATLTNSRILAWPVSGEAAVRTGWGPSAGLVASVGGLHPQFPVPANFPTLQRLTINFGTNNPALTLTAYMAVTLSSVQAGASASLYVKGPDIWLVGQVEVEGWASFDALIRFDPFEFDAKLSLGLKLLLDGDTVCGIGGDVRLRGPNTYRISGKVWVGVCGVDVKVSVSHTWGEKKTELVQILNPLDVLRAAIEETSCVEPIQVTSRVSGVSFTTGDASETAALVDPVGGLRFVQRALPLRVALERLGNARIAGDYRVFTLAFRDRLGAPLAGTPFSNEFVRAQFFNLTDTQKLREKATQPFECGLETASGHDLVVDPARARNIEFDYETIFLGDDTDLAKPLGTFAVNATVAKQWMARATGSVAATANPAFVPEVLRVSRITVQPISYAATNSRVTTRGPVIATDATTTTPLEGNLDSVLKERDNKRVLARYLVAAN